MKILFIIPAPFNPKKTYQEYPLGPGFVATAIQKDGHEVYIVDQGVEEDFKKILEDLLSKHNFQVIAFSVITPSYHEALEIQSWLAQKTDAFFVAGGLHPTLFPLDFLSNGFDFVIQGEGETAMRKLLKILGRTEDFSSIPGLAYKNKGILRFSKELAHSDFSDIHSPIDRSMYNLGRYSHHTILTSRGCPFQCKFCCNYSRVFKKHATYPDNLASIFNEMEAIITKFNSSSFFFADDNLFTCAKRARDFCAGLHRLSRRPEWLCQCRTDIFNEEIADALVDAGCKIVNFGIEAGSQEILNRAEKRIPVNLTPKAINIASERNLIIRTNWIFGLPGSLDEQLESLYLMQKLPPHQISIHQFIPFPGTDYYDNPQKYGIKIKNPKDFSGFVYGGINRNIEYDYLSISELEFLFKETINVLEKAGYVSSDKANSENNAVFTTPLSKTSIPLFSKRE